MKTMSEEYGEPDDKLGKHVCCEKCGRCVTCGDCVCEKSESKEKEIIKAIFISKTGVAGVGKNRWECPECKKNKEPEYRFNLSFGKINCFHKCRFCKIKLWLE